jgi:hypothetical protein
MLMFSNLKILQVLSWNEEWKLYYGIELEIGIYIDKQSTLGSRSEMRAVCAMW